ncbi:SRPBCC domain-containing protein [Arthrobacter sp. ISL-30]|uniref:SRPBCC domain-containing protein n=1 Tax=Arthrobacter sp. ISL-30 TaxID=2819109 RepID=UPI001BE71D1D|nr:SRPBCC domain-containing protein [Arthrobacter sp. ISL-30]MBT2515290.1 SRPBCC domain-containing protein [Arthrobacter sp. ISL-30]
MTNNLSVVMNCDAQQVWAMLREPSLVAQWHGWESEDLRNEINQIYFSDTVVEAPDHTSLTVAGGDVFELRPVPTGTEVKVTRSALDHDSEWVAWDEDITQGWLTFLHQLRFAIEHHPHGHRRTLFFQAAGKNGSIISKLRLDDPPKRGESYSLTLDTGEEISGKVWYKTNHQVGLTVHSYAEHGDGLLIVADQPPVEEVRPDGGSMVIISTYDLGAHDFEAIRNRWDKWREEKYPESEPIG